MNQLHDGTEQPENVNFLKTQEESEMDLVANHIFSSMAVVS